MELTFDNIPHTVLMTTFASFDTAVAAGRAQKKLVKGKNQAALQKLGHAGRNAMAITTLAR